MKISEALLLEISNNTYTNNQLKIDGPEIHYEDMIKLTNAIKLNKYIKKFVIIEVESIDEESLMLLGALTNLEEIIAGDACVTNDIARELLKSSVKALCLVSNNLSDSCLDGIENNKTLVNLSLSANQFTTRGIEMLSKNESIEELNLSQCGLDDSCVGYLSSMKSLKKLDLSANDITDVGFKVLYDSNIREIILSGDRGEHGIEKITEERFKLRGYVQPPFPKPAFEASKKPKRKGDEKEEAEEALEAKPDEAESSKEKVGELSPKRLKAAH